MLEFKEKREDPESDLYSMPSPKQQRKSRNLEKNTSSACFIFIF